MKKTLLSNPGLKIASLLLAVLVWLIIVNVNDPVITKTIFNVPVTVTSASYIESMGQSYQVKEGDETVSVTVHGNRSVVEPLTADSITATADLTEIVDMNSDPITVPVRVSANGISAGNITANPATIEIELEEMISSDFVITGSSGTTVPAEGYQVGNVTASPEKVTIYGPASIINKIDRVVAPVDVTGISMNSNFTTSLVIYDKNGEALTDAEMNYLKFDIDSKNIQVSVTLYTVVSDVVIDVPKYTGKPAAGYQVSSMTATPASLSVAGTAEGLKNLADKGNTITIDSGLIDVSGKSSSFDVKVDDVSAMLPDNVFLANGISNTVVISVEILPLNSKSYEIATTSIQKLNLGAGLTCVFSTANIDVGVKGTDEQLESLSTDQIKASVDLNGLEAGTYTLPVAITLPSGYEQVEDVTVNATLSEIGTAAAGPASISAAVSAAS